MFLHAMRQACRAQYDKNLTMSNILITGVAGFIGLHVAKLLLSQGHKVHGIDNINDYYETSLKDARLAQISGHIDFEFERLDVSDTPAVLSLFDRCKFDTVIHLAAQAGVRYSITNPHAYAQSNLVGFVNVLEGCRHHGVKHLVYASSSSVYGGNTKMPFSESDSVDHPVSLYAATKKANELMAHTYSHLYGLPTTGLRFFTVYGPWGRPDMAPFLFARAMLAGEPIKVFNHGHMRRDFTYIDDIADGVVAVAIKPAGLDELFNRTQPDAATSWAPYRVFNIGRSEPVPLMDFIDELAGALGVAPKLDLQPMAPGDVAATYSDTSKLASWTGVEPNVSLSEGVSKFVNWYRGYYNV
jgi:UDP-glucuronate 4-epimerase